MSDQQIKTKRQLAIAIGRHHSTVLDWLVSPAWPFPRVAPWPSSMVVEMQQWAATRPPPGYSPENWKRAQANRAAAAM